MNAPTKYVGFERHAITALTLVIVALILWVGSGVQQNQVKLAAIEVELSYIKKNTLQDTQKFYEIEKRLDSIEQQLKQHAANDGTHIPSSR